MWQEQRGAQVWESLQEARLCPLKTAHKIQREEVGEIAEEAGEFGWDRWRAGDTPRERTQHSGQPPDNRNV